jgi:hypothetical protein
MTKQFFSKLIFGTSIFGSLWTFVLSEADARWEPDSPTQMKCSKLNTPKKCNKDKDCFWEPVQPQCTGNTSCIKIHDESTCNKAEREGCYWFVPTEEDLLHVGYCFEKGSFPEPEKP